jgi:hypothetical protein
VGFLKVCEEGGEVKIERVFPAEIVVDEAAAWTAEPRTMFQKKYMPVEVLVAEFPTKEAEIMASSKTVVNDGAVDSGARLVEVVEGWHLPSKKFSAGEKSDGRHVWVVDGATLVDEEWKERSFPFVIVRWNKKPPIGWYGHGLAEDLRGIQKEINAVVTKIQRALRLCSIAYLFKPRGCDVPDEHFINQDGVIIDYAGERPPTLHAAQAVNPENFQYLWSLYEKAYEMAGVSAMSARGQRMPGVESGRAIREYQDIQSQRFALNERTWERLFIDLAKKVIWMARMIYGSKKKLSVKVPGKQFLETISWGDVNLEEDQYYVKVWPTSILPKSPAGRLATVQEMMQAGLIQDMTVAQSLLDFPEIDKYAGVQRAAIDDLHATFDAMIFDGEWSAPDEFQNLQLGMQWAQAYWLKYRHEQAPEENLRLLEQWLLQARRILEAPTIPTPQEAAAQQMAGPEGQTPMPPEEFGAAGREAGNMTGAPPEQAVAGM